MNRLKNAYYKNLSNGFGDTYNVNLTYDKNGNIQTLNRKGGAEAIYTPTIDNLKYFYANNSNTLKKVVDLTNNPQGFKDDSSGSLATDPENDYRYDQYGNMTADQNKQITRIKYNHLNLPTEIAFANDRLIRYTYDASGTKMKKVALSPYAENITLYRDGFQYSKKNNEALKLQFFPTAEGYVKPIYKRYEINSTEPRFQYVYNYTDHLGNIRLQYTKMVGLRILEEDSYYPFGLKHKEFNDIGQVEDRSYKYKYKYNGKELQEEFGLNVYDYGARNYDAALGRWLSVDPLAEKYQSVSPYNYTLNNPINLVDPDGRTVKDWYEKLDKDGKETGEIVWYKGSKNYKGYKNRGKYYTVTDENSKTIFYDGKKKLKYENGVVTKDYNNSTTKKVLNFAGNFLSTIAEGVETLGYVAVGTVKMFYEAGKKVSEGGDVEGLHVDMDMPMYEYNNGKILKTDLKHYSKGELTNNAISTLTTPLSVKTGAGLIVDKAIKTGTVKTLKTVITKSTEKK